MPIRYLGLDGDDTLWHNETRFQLTQAALGDLLRRHVPDADVETRLSAVEMRNLGIYGYGIKAFTLSMLETAIEVTGGRIPAAVGRQDGSHQQVAARTALGSLKR